MAMAVDLSELVKQVSFAGRAAPSEVAAVWGGLCEHIAERLASGVGVQLPGLGCFAVGPAFVLDAARFGGVSLSAARGGLATPGAPSQPVGFHAVAVRARVRRVACTRLVRLLLERVAGCVSARDPLALDWGLGCLLYDGRLRFAFSDAFLARCGLVPAPSRAPSRLRASMNPGGQQAAAAEDALLAACRAADWRCTGTLPRNAVEALLRGPCSGCVAGMEALTLLALLETCTLAGAQCDYRALAQHLAARTAQPASSAAVRSPPRQSPSRAAAAPVPAPVPRSAPPRPPTPLPLPNDAFLSRPAVDALNRALLAARQQGSLGRWEDSAAAVTAKVGAQPVPGFASRPATPWEAVGAQGRRWLSEAKRAEVAADAQRLRHVQTALQEEEEQTVRVRAAQQAALRASLDEQVVTRVDDRRRAASVAAVHDAYFYD